jgi:hypothetical protein
MYEPGRLAPVYLQEAYTLLAPTIQRRVKARAVQDIPISQQTELCAERTIQ